MGAFLGKEAQRRDVSTISPAAAASTARADTPPVYAQNQYQRFAEAGKYDHRIEKMMSKSELLKSL